MGKFQTGNARASRLSNDQVNAVRERYAAGNVTQRQLAREFQVHENTISRIIAGVTRINVPAPLRMPTEEEAQRSMARVLAALNQTAEQLPVAREVAAERSLLELKAESYGAKHTEQAVKLPSPADDAAKAYMEMVARLQGGDAQT